MRDLSTMSLVSQGVLVLVSAKSSSQETWFCLGCFARLEASWGPHVGEKRGHSVLFLLRVLQWFKDSGPGGEVGESHCPTEDNRQGRWCNSSQDPVGLPSEF